MNNKTKKILSAALAVLTATLISSCDNSGQSNFEEAYVLEGWMPLGHRIGVRISKTVDIEAYYDYAAVGVTGASVTIWESLNGDTTTYFLIPDSTAVRGTYIAPEAGDSVKSGFDYAIRIEVDGHVIAAETHRAPPPFVLDSVRIGNESAPTARDPNNPPVYEWEKRIGEGENSLLAQYTLFYQLSAGVAGVNFIIECMEPDWYDNDDLELSGENGPGITNTAFWTVLEGDTFSIPPIVINYQGEHRVRAMNVDSIGYEYCQTAFPGQVDWNPPTNVSGALGLFTVYDADTVYFCVTDPDADVTFQCR